MDTCTVETGLLKKKPCGRAAATRCKNCEQPICSQHSVPEPTATGKKTGKFMCKECAAAWRQHDEMTGGEAAAPAPAPAEKKPAAPAVGAAPKPAAAKPAPGAAKPAEKKEEKKEEKKPDDDAPLEFTPTKK